MKVKNVHSKLNVPDLTQHVEYENIGPFISHVANGMLDSNWRHLLDSINADLEIHIGNIVKSILGPIFDEVAITEFTYESSDLDENPVESVPQNSNSSSVAQKLAFSLLTGSLALSSRMFQYFYII